MKVDAATYANEDHISMIGASTIKRTKITDFRSSIAKKNIYKKSKDIKVQIKPIDLGFFGRKDNNVYHDLSTHFKVKHTPRGLIITTSEISRQSDQPKNIKYNRTNKIQVDSNFIPIIQHCESTRNIYNNINNEKKTRGKSFLGKLYAEIFSKQNKRKLNIITMNKISHKRHSSLPNNNMPHNKNLHLIKASNRVSLMIQ